MLPLYNRLNAEQVLDNYTRGKIFGYVIANPGAHYTLIRQDLQVPNGALAHHLSTLAREQLITAHRVGMRKVFYPADHRGPRPQLQPIQEAILGFLQHKPGARQRDIAHALRLRPDTVHYHLQALNRAGRVKVVREEGILRYTSRDESLL